MEDAKILDLLWSRSEQAIDALSRRFGARLHATAHNLLSDPQDSEECVNDTYLALWNSIPPRRPTSLAAYVYRTGRNIALNRLRANTAQKRDGHTLSLDELSAFVPAPEDRHDLGQALDAFLDKLEPRSRAIFLRRYWFGDSIGDIAQDLRMTENAVALRLHRTREQLRTYLKEEGYYG